jgi:hypothetical protein
VSRRGLLLAALAVLGLLGGAPAGAQAEAAGERGPDALWEAYPLEERPRPAGGEAKASAGTAETVRDRVAFSRQEPREAPTLAIATAVCVAIGVALSAAGLVLLRGERHGHRAG